MLLGPPSGQLPKVQILLAAHPPIQIDRILQPQLDGMFDNPLDRGKTGSAGHHHQIVAGVFTQVESTERSFHPQHLFLLHLVKDVWSKVTPLNQTDMELDLITIVGGISDGEGAAFTIFHQYFNILTGKKLHGLLLRLLQKEAHHIICQMLNSRDLDRHIVDLDLFRPLHLLDSDLQITFRLRLATDDHSRLQLLRSQRLRLVLILIVDLTTDQLRLAGTTKAVLTTIREGNPLP